MTPKLGQNFLTSKSVAKIIASVLKLDKKEKIIEIGAGKGILTDELLKLGNEVVAIEKDTELAKKLKSKYRKNKNIEIVKKDIREFEFPKENYSVISNIPYYITGLIIRTLLQNKPNGIALLVQKEVGERIARSKKESVLSLSVKFYGKPKYIKTISKGVFSPIPKVDSAIIAITDIKNRSSKEEKKFFSFIKQGFSNKRKKLVNNLDEDYQKLFLEFADKNNFNQDIRAEDVTLDVWLKIIDIEN